MKCAVHPVLSPVTKTTGIFASYLSLWFEQFLYKEQRKRGLSNGYIPLLIKGKMFDNLLLLRTSSQWNFTQEKPTLWLLRNVSLCYFSGVATKFIFARHLIVDLGGKRKWFSVPCFHFLQNRIQYRPPLLKHSWNPLPRSLWKRHYSPAFTTEMGQAW